MNEPLLDAVAMAELVRRRELSPRELVDAAIAQNEARHGELNAVIHPRYERARAEADVMTAAMVGGRIGPLGGVPFVVKDLGAEMADEPHHCGCRGLRSTGYRAPLDSRMYSRFRALGLIAIGRTNTAEFGTTITTEPVAYGPTPNPWNRSHSSGGSSGGSAAAVAAGIVPIGHGNDAAGSIRIPASACGVVGLKPSSDRNLLGTLTHDAWSGARVEGLLTRSVRDAAVVLGLMSGDIAVDRRGALSLPSAVGAPLDGDVHRLRVGIAPTVTHGHVEPECARAVEVAGLLAADLGHEVVTAVPEALGDELFMGHFTALLAVAIAADLSGWAAVLGRPLGRDDVEGDTWALAEMGRRTSRTEYEATSNWFDRWRRSMLGWWAEDGFDVLITSTLGSPPPVLGWLRDSKRGTARLREIMLTTAQFNISGQPAISLPLAMSSQGLPIGVQLVGRPGGEDVILMLAAQLEARSPWMDRRPG